MATQRGKSRVGRPKLDEKLKLAEIMDRYLGDEELVSVLADHVRDGNLKAIQLWLNYKHGAPKQVVEQKSEHTIKSFNLKEMISFDEQDSDTKQV